MGTSTVMKAKRLILIAIGGTLGGSLALMGYPVTTGGYWVVMGLWAAGLVIAHD